MVAVHAEKGRHPAVVLGRKHPGTAGSGRLGCHEERATVVRRPLDDDGTVGHVDLDLVDGGCFVSVLGQPGRRLARSAGGIDDEIGGDRRPIGRFVPDDHALDGGTVVGEVVNVLTPGTDLDVVTIGDAPTNELLEQRSGRGVRQKGSRPSREEIALLVVDEIGHRIDHDTAGGEQFLAVSREQVLERSPPGLQQ